MPDALEPALETTSSTGDAAAVRTLVTLSRSDPGDVQQRQVLARIDDGPQVTLAFGDRVTIEVQPGAHVLKANNTLFWKRLPFTIGPGEHVEFATINRQGRFTLGFLAIMGVAPLFLSIERRSLA